MPIIWILATLLWWLNWSSMPPCVTRPAYMALISNGVVACICKYCHTYFLNLLRVFLKVVTSIFVNLVELVASACAGPAYRALMATALLPPLSHWCWPLKGQWTDCQSWGLLLGGGGTVLPVTTLAIRHTVACRHPTHTLKGDTFYQWRSSIKRNGSEAVLQSDCYIPATSS